MQMFDASRETAGYWIRSAMEEAQFDPAMDDLEQQLYSLALARVRCSSSAASCRFSIRQDDELFFASIAPAAESFRFTCGPVRGAPEYSTQR